ncbi:MAG TPA: DinB family protein [Anaerolineales bacterium]|nr:DinB family protein [Anaerolineales bacterium]
MDKTWKAVLWHQFGAAIQMLDNALQACPEELWQARLYEERSLQPDFAEFWYVVYHALFWLDFYLSDSVEGFSPPVPFTLSEFDPAGLLPERVYTKDELQTYLEYGRDKCRTRIATLTDEMAPQHCRPEWPEMSIAELLLYNMRHVQEHAAHLNLILGQRIGWSPGWVASEKSRVSEE